MSLKGEESLSEISLLFKVSLVVIILVVILIIWAMASGEASSSTNIINDLLCIWCE